MSQPQLGSGRSTHYSFRPFGFQLTKSPLYQIQQHKFQVMMSIKLEINPASDEFASRSDLN